MFSDLAFQSTLPVRGATPTSKAAGVSTVISIHAPRAGSDAQAMQDKMSALIFQSTLPVRGATVSWARKGADHDYFNPRSPCGERHDSLLAEAFPEFVISIHAPRAGSDEFKTYLRGEEVNFNPRSPCGERHGNPLGSGEDADISIHAPRAGSDVAV